MTETRNLLVQEPERVSQTETVTQGGQTGAARGVNPEAPGDETGWHLWVHTAGPARVRGPTPSPWGRVLGGSLTWKLI